MKQSIMFFLLLLVSAVITETKEEQKFGGRFAIDSFVNVGQYSPLIVEVPDKIVPGQTLTFNGIVKTKGNEFIINLESMAAKSTVLQIHIWFWQKQIYFNSLPKQGEEKAEMKPHTLEIGKPFEISLEACADHFKIRIDGEDFAEYKYRQPLAFISHFEIKTYGFLNSYKFGDKFKAFPSVTGAAESFPICKETTPKNECASVVVTGTIGVEFYRTSINLYRKNQDVAVTFNPRFDENVVILTTQTNDAWWWGNYNSVPKLALKVGERLEVEFVNRESGFQIYVNKKDFFNFTHRIPSFDIAGVEVANLRDPVITVK